MKNINYFRPNLKQFLNHSQAIFFMKGLEELISTYKDFPKKGIAFKDVLEIIQNPEIFRELISKMSLS